MIDLAELKTLLGDKAGRFDVDALAECDSTNRQLYERASLGAPSGSVIVADRQTAGRGRRGRNWNSAQNDPEASLTFSLLWRFCPVKLSGLPLVIGIAVVRSLQQLGIVETRLGLKWPNDILLKVGGNWGKLGGILVELEPTPRKFAHAERETTAVIGIGLNLKYLPEMVALNGSNLAPVALQQGMDGMSGMNTGSPLPQRARLLTQLLCELQSALDEFEQQGFALFIDEWHTRHAWQGQPVQLLLEGVCQHEGRAAGVDTQGSFLIETAGGIKQVWSGDVSLRRIS